MLFQLALQYSDHQLSDVFDSIDIPRELQETLPVVSPKNYASVLKSLFFSSYLTKQSSSAILAALTRSIQRNRIVAGLPEGTIVAHKIGEYDVGDSAENTHSDCGIVYLPRRPYILCIMTNGSEAEATVHIQNLSRMIYLTFHSEVQHPSATSEQP